MIIKLMNLKNKKRKIKIIYYKSMMIKLMNLKIKH